MTEILEEESQEIKRFERVQASRIDYEIIKPNYENNPFIFY